jgi:hypothetical protein
LEGSTSPWLIEPLSLVFVIETVNFKQNEAIYSHARMDVLAIISGNATNITEKPEKIKKGITKKLTVSETETWH